MKTRIYRMQDRSGRGPFRPGFSHKWAVNRPDHALLLPFYCEFPELYLPDELGPKEHCGVGCLSPDQLRRWFIEPEYMALMGHGYKAVSMTADRIIRNSDIQCVFARKRALRKGVIEIPLYPLKELG